ncbi:MAG: hypothetical protein WAV21_02305 [Minisyncoccia bacterium]
MENKGHSKDGQQVSKETNFDNFVLEKSIFSNIFDKDIRRVYIYKKAERLARAVHLVTPAFVHSPALRMRSDTIAVALVDAAILPPGLARAALSKELLSLSSLLSMARTGGLLSAMNAELISHEAHNLLQEIAGYEEPRLSFEHVPTLAELSKSSSGRVVNKTSPKSGSRKALSLNTQNPKGQYKGHVLKDNEAKNGRRENILAVLKTKGPSYIKDISTMVRGVSEKTIQRELQALTQEGIIIKEGERRWTTYTIAV